MEQIEQQVINDNKDIYGRIQSELVKAEFEILIATAWFTDDDLYDILLTKLAEGVHIGVIVADNQENEDWILTGWSRRALSFTRSKTAAMAA